MEPISIAFFTWGLSSDAITNIAAALAQGFWKLGIRNIYVVYLNGSPDENISFPKGVEFIHLGVHRARLAPFPIAKFLRAFNPTFFISLAFLNIPAILGWFLAGRTSTKLIISQQNTLIYKAQIEHQGEPLMQVQLWLARFLYSRVNGLVATTPSLLQELVEEVGVSLPTEHKTVIPNLVDVQLVQSQSQIAPTHTWFQPKEKPVILSVARLAKQKNFPLLLNAFAIVQKHLDARLIIIGEGSEREALENQVQDMNLNLEVSLPGSSDNPWSSMLQSDVFILPSEEEAFGLVLVEAMACGLPVVATDAIAGGPRSIIGDSEYGILVPNGDAQALAEGIIKILTSSELRNHLIARGRERCKVFDSQIVAKQWLSFIKQL
jgi:glycosyltransferase involved in cell wall biosynthesis